MWTLYAPCTGVVAEVTPDAVTLTASGTVVAAPADGSITDLTDGRCSLLDGKGRGLTLEVTGGPDALVTRGAEVAVDQPLFSWPAEGQGRTVRVRVEAETLPHVKVGDAVAAGADLLSVGPFACGA